VFAFKESQSRSRLFVLDTERLMWHCRTLSGGGAVIVAFYIKGERRIVSLWGAAIAEVQLGESLVQINHSLDLLSGLRKIDCQS
jgi:hypothetical protein